ncbi:hypothetical protein Tco_1212482 [Tanacetum coccineum]
MRQKLRTTSIPPPSDDKERDDIAEATLLSLTMHKTALSAEAQENVAKVQEKLMEEDIKKMPESHKANPEVFDDDDVDDNVDKEKKNDDVEEKKDDMNDDNDDHVDHTLVRGEVSDSVFQDDNDDSGNRLEPESHKANPEVVDDDDVDDNVDKVKKNDDVEEKKEDMNDDNDDHVDHTLVRGEVSDKTLSKELTTNVSPTPDTTSKDPNMSQHTSSTSKILPGSVAELSRHRSQLREQLSNIFITKEYFQAISRMVNDAVKKDREIFADVVPELVLKEFATHAPKIIEELFKHHMKNKVLNVHPTDILKKKFEKSSVSASSGKVHDAHQGK